MRKLTLVTIGVATLALAGCGPKPDNTVATDNMAVSSSAGDPAVADNVTAPADIANMSAPSDTTAPSSSSDGKIK